MLTELCQYLKNWFELDQISGKVTITDNTITVVSDGLLYDGDAPTILTGQYVRIIGSVFNDGVVQYGVDELTNENLTERYGCLESRKQSLIWPKRSKHGNKNMKSLVALR